MENSVFDLQMFSENTYVVVNLGKALGQENPPPVTYIDWEGEISTEDDYVAKLTYADGEYGLTIYYDEYSDVRITGADVADLLGMPINVQKGAEDATAFTGTINFTGVTDEKSMVGFNINNLTITNASSVTIGLDGVTGLQAGAAYTYAPSSGDAVTYEVKTLSGDTVIFANDGGTLTGYAPKGEMGLADLAIMPAGDEKGVVNAEAIPASSSVAGKVSLSFSGLAENGNVPVGTAYYALYYDESQNAFTLGDKLTALPDTSDSNVLGYIKVEATNEGGETEIVVSLQDTNGKDAAFNGDLKFGVNNLKSVGGNPLNYLTFDENLATGKVYVMDVTPTADVSVNGVDVTDDNDYVDYEDTYTLSSTARTINLKSAADIADANDDHVAYIAISNEKSPDGHDKWIYKLATEATGDVEAAGDWYFEVASRTDETTGRKTYSITAIPEGLLGNDCWKDLILNAAEISSSDVEITFESTDKAVYTVKNLAYGVAVNQIDPPGYDLGEHIIMPETRTGDQGTRIVYKDGDETLTGVALLNGDTAGTVYWKVTQTEDNDGNLRVTIEKSNQASTEDTAGTNTPVAYIKVVSDGNGTCTVTYEDNDTGLKLQGLTPADPDTSLYPDMATIDLVPAAGTTKENTSKIVIGSADGAYFACIGIPAGTEVEKDSPNSNCDVEVRYALTFENDVTISLKDLTEGTYCYKVVVDKNVPWNKGYAPVRSGGIIQDPVASDNYFQVVVDENRSYTVSYHKAAATAAVPNPEVIDLEADTTIGKTTIDADDLPAEGTKITLWKSNDSSGLAYEVTNVATGGYTDDGFIKEGVAGSDPADKTAGISYDVAYVLDPQSAAIELGNTGTYYRVTKTSDGKGTTTIKITALSGEDAESVSDSDSYFTVEANGYASGIVFHEPDDTEPNASAVTTADFAAIHTANVNQSDDSKKLRIPVNAAHVTGSESCSYYIALTDDNVVPIDYDVKSLPSTVSIESFGDGDKCSYRKSYSFAKPGETETDNVLKLGTAPGTSIYAVTATGGTDADRGIYKCSIATEPAETPPMPASYFEVVTADDGNVAITYHHSGEDAAANIDLDGLNVSVDASGAGDNAVITIGAANDDSIEYKVNNMKPGQTAQRAEGADVNAYVGFEYAESTLLAYTAGTGITADGLALLSADTVSLGTDLSKTYYYTVTASGPSDKNVTTYTIAAKEDINTAPESGSYFAVTYTADGAKVLYVKATEDGIDLSAAGQVMVDATNLTAGTLDITDGEGAQVNYTLKNVVGGEVSVQGATKGQDIIYQEASITLTATITDLANGAVYVINKVTGEDDAVTYELAKATEAQAENLDALNRFTVAKVGNNYTINYIKSNSDAYTLSNDSKVSVDASDLKNAALTNSSTVPISVENAKAGTTVSGENLTISYTTGITWAKGTYYFPADESVTSIDTTSGDTAVDGTYLIVEVDQAEDGTFSVSVSTNVVTVADAGNLPATVAAANVLEGENVRAYWGSNILVFDVPGGKLNADGFEGVIIGVANGALLTHVGDGVNDVITAKEFKAGDSFSVSAGEAAAAVTYTAGADGEISVIKGKVEYGTLAMANDGTTTLTGSGDMVDDENYKSITLGAASDGLVVTFEGGKVSAVTGMNIFNKKAGSAESFTYGEYSYYAQVINNQNYIRKYNTTTGISSFAAVTVDADDAVSLDVMNMEYYTGSNNATAVPTLSTDQFKWEEDTYLLKAENGLDSTVEPEEIPQVGENDDAGYYLKAVVTAVGDVGRRVTITVLQNNAQGLPSQVEDSAYKGTIKIVGDGNAIAYTKPENAGYTLEITGVKAASDFSGLGDEDTLTTSADFGTSQITVNDVTYTSYESPLSFQGGALSSGTVNLFGNATTEGDENVGQVIFNGAVATIFYDDGVTDTENPGNVHITVGKDANEDTTVTSIKELDPDETLTFQVMGTVGGSTVTSYTYAADNEYSKTITFTPAGIGTQPTTREYRILLGTDANGDVLAADNIEAVYNDSFDLTAGNRFVNIYADGHFDSLTFAPNNSDTDAVSLVVKDGELTSITGLDSGETLIRESDTKTVSYDGYSDHVIETTVYKDDADATPSLTRRINYTADNVAKDVLDDNTNEIGVVDGQLKLTNDYGSPILFNYEGKAHNEVLYHPADGEDTLDITVENGEVTSLSNLQKGGSEKLEVVSYNADGEAIGSVAYTAAAIDDDEEHILVTKIAVDADGNQTVYTKTVAVDADVIAGDWTTANAYQNSLVLNLVGEEPNTQLPGDGMGYYLINTSGYPMTATVQENSATGFYEEGQYYVRAMVRPGVDNKDLLSVKLDAFRTDSKDGLVALEDTSVLAGTVVNLNLGTAPVSYVKEEGSPFVIKAADAANHSELTLGDGDTVTTREFTADEAAAGADVKVNGTTYTAAGAGALSFQSYTKDDTKSAYVLDGTLLLNVEGDETAEFVGLGANGTSTVAYNTDSPGYADGVKVTFTDGVLTGLMDLDEGESVSVTTGTNTVTYEGHDYEVAWKTESSTGKTYAVYIDSDDGIAGANICNIPSTGEADADGYWKEVTDQTYTLDWNAEGDSVGYFDLVVHGIESGTFTTAEVPAELEGKTINHTNAGETYLQVYVNASGTLTLRKATVTYTGALEAKDIADEDHLTKVEIAANNQAITYAKTTNVGEVDLTNVGTNSEITGFTAADDVQAAMTDAGTITVNGHAFHVANLNSGNEDPENLTSNIITISGMEGDTDAIVTSGTFVLNEPTNNGHRLTSMAGEVETVVKYQGQTNFGNGVQVTVEAGRITSLTGLSDREAVTVTEGGVETNYLAQMVDDSLVITKETKDGSKWTYGAENDSVNVLSLTDDDWAPSSLISTSWFAFGDTTDGRTTYGYFKATVDDNNVATVEIETQESKVEIPAPTSSDPIDRLYYFVEATKDAETGNISVNILAPVCHHDNGTWASPTEEDLAEGGQYADIDWGTVTVTLPGTTGEVFFNQPGPGYEGLAVNGGAITSGAVLSGLRDVDTFTGQLVADATFTLTVGKTKKVYTSGADNNTITLMGNGHVKAGTFIVKGTDDLTASNNGAVVTYEAAAGEQAITDGVKVTFASGEINTITDLEAGEKAIVTAANGKVTTYSTTDGTTITKTEVADGITEAFRTTTAITEGADVMSATYGHVSSFDADNWANDVNKVIYFQYASTDVTYDIATQAETVIAPAEDNYILRMVMTSSKDDNNVTTYYIKDVTITSGSGETPATDTATTTFNLTAKGNLTLVPEITENNTVADRAYKLNITAEAGQAFNGLTDADTITTGSLLSDAGITVNGQEYLNGNISVAALSVTGSGKAISGTFAVTGEMSFQNDARTIEAGENSNVSVLVTNGALMSITKLSDGESVTVTNADGTSTRYEAILSGDESSLVIKRFVTNAQGDTVASQAEVDKNNLNIDILTISESSYVPATDGNATSGQLNWTAAGSRGYFLVDNPTIVVDGENSTFTGWSTPIEIAAQDERVTITGEDAGKYYLKVETAYADETSSLTKLEVYLVDESGKLTLVDAGSLTGTVTVKAPEGVKFNLDAAAKTVADPEVPVFPEKVSFAIEGAAAGSALVLRDGDTLTTAELTNGQTVTVNGKVFTAKGIYQNTTQLKFNSGAFLTDGDVEMTAADYTFSIAGMDKDGSTADDMVVSVVNPDNVELATNPVVTVEDGMVKSVVIPDGVRLRVAAESENGLAIEYYTDTIDGEQWLCADVTNLTDKDLTLKNAHVVKVTVGNDVKTFTNAKLPNLTLKLNNDVVEVVDGNLSIPAEGTLSTANGDVLTVNAGDGVIIIVKDGAIESITGFAENESVTITNKAAGTTTTYMQTNGLVTKTTTVGSTTTNQAAMPNSDGEIIKDVTYASVDEMLVGQFSWDTSVEGREIGYFQMKASGSKDPTYKATVAEQTAEAAGYTKNGKNLYYLKAIREEDETGRAVLKFEAVKTSNTTTGTGTAAVSDTSVESYDIHDFSRNDEVTITAPTEAIVYDKGMGDEAAGFKVIINKLAAGSELDNLDAGDKVTTASLAEDAVITFDEDNVFVSGAKNNTLIFLGEGDNTADAPDNTVALLSGTIKLAADASALLAGDSETKEKTNSYGTSNDITVSAGEDNQSTAIVKVKDGAVSSITGLTAKGDKVIVANVSGSVKTTNPSTNKAETITYEKATITYEVLDAAGTMVEKKITYTSGETPKTVTQFLNLTKAGGEIYSGTYKDATPTDYSKLSFSNSTSSDLKTVGYVALGANPEGDEDGEIISDVTTEGNSLVTAANHEDGTEITGNNKQFVAVPGNYYLQVSATAAKNNGTVTINSITLMKADATGKLAASKENYSGSLIIDGTKGEASYAAIKCTALPTADKRSWAVTVRNVDANSEFTNLGAGDTLTTVALDEGDKVTVNKVAYFAADAEENSLSFENGTAKSGTFLMRKDAKSISTSGGTKVSYDTVKDDVIIIVKNGEVDGIKGLDRENEKVTVTSASGVTNVYEVIASGKVKRTATTAAGLKTVAIRTGVTEDVDVTDDGTNWTVSETTIESTFDWTTAKNTTGYFKVEKDRNNADKPVEIKKQTSATKIASGDANAYIAVEISADGVVKSIQQVKFAGNDVTPTEAEYTNTITITAPTNAALTFDRDVLEDNVEGATLAIKGAIAGSVIDNIAGSDTVTTASLKAGAVVTVNDVDYTASAAGALSFAFNEDAGDEGAVFLTGGTVVVGTEETLNLYSVTGSGKDKVTKLVEVKPTRGSINVKATATSYTITGLDEQEEFTVAEDGVTYTYQKVNGGLLCTYENAEQNTTVYKLLTGTSYTNANLTTFTGNSWKDVEPNFTGTDEDIWTTKYGDPVVKLSTMDTRYKADVKAGVANTIYNYVVDKYVQPATKSQTAAVVNGEVTSDALVQIGRVVIGDITHGSTTYNYYYDAEGTEDGSIAQAIQVAAGWLVDGSAGDDTFTGATSGADYLRGYEGNDTYDLKGAADTVAVDLDSDGQDIVKGYTSGKDAIEIIDGVAIDAATPNNESITDMTLYYDNEFQVHLGTDAADVYLYKEDTDNQIGTDKDTDSYVKLTGMGSNKAVTINGETYYFGSGKLERDATQTKAGASFTYVEGAYYYGNDSGKNSLKVGTDKTKATKTTLGAVVEVDLNAENETTGRSYYNNITTVDASSSGNEVVLTAGSDEKATYTLKGGSYKSTLKAGAGHDVLTGGSGEDTFVFKEIEGTDTITSYTSGKDKLNVAGETDLTKDGYGIKASGNDVVIGNGSNSITIQKAVNAAKAVTVTDDNGNDVNYYVGKAGANNNFTTYSSTAYYIGSNGTDTVKLGAKDVGATVDMDANGSQYQDIEVVDASSLNVSGATKGVDFKAGTTAVEFKASKYADTITAGDKTTITYTAAANMDGDTVKNFGVDDLIQINGLKNVEFSTTETENTYVISGTKDKKTYSMTVEIAAGSSLEEKTVGNNVQIGVSYRL